MPTLTGPRLFTAAVLALPVLAGFGLAAALDQRSTPVAVVLGLLVAAAWGASVVAVLVPRSLGLTVLRIALPALAAVGLWTVVTEPGPAAFVAAGATVGLTAALLAAPVLADHFVDGSSYGNERRMQLRVPVALLVGPVPLVWVATVAGATAGPLLLAAGHVVAGAAAVVVGLPVAYLGARSLHRLARRWLVFVPTGLVLHDPLALLDPLAVPRSTIRLLGPAVAEGADRATDTTLGALGLVLELRLAAPTQLALRARGRRAADARETDRILFAVTRPGALMEEASKRKLPLGFVAS